MEKSTERKLLKSIEKIIITDLTKEILNLKLDEKTQEQVLSIFTKKDKKKRTRPKIPKEKQCKEICKDGTKCVTAKCFNNKCWAHMGKDERIIYKEVKERKKLSEDI